MDWSLLLLLAIGGGFLLWRQSKNAEVAKVANERLTKDNALYQHIKAGMREYDWRRRQVEFKDDFGLKHGQVIFETAHFIAYKVSHFAESRIGFYFKDLDEYGMYSFFAGNGDDYFETYYRTDKTFETEGRLLHDD